MRIMIDLNVALDVVQRRTPHYEASAIVMTKALENDLTGCLPSHALTTLHYIVEKSAGCKKADELIDWLLDRFEIIEEGKNEFVRARSLDMRDFEDASVASAALRGKCDYIITRNIADFMNSPIPALAPEEFLAGIGNERA